jgi:hypothetical protein
MSDILETWVRCKPWIEAALRHNDGGYAPADVWARIEAGRAQFWPGARCAVVTEWMSSPRRNTLNIWLMGGDLEELLGPMLTAIEAWAVANDAEQIVGGAYDRPGWIKALGRAGFNPKWIMFSKELSR